MITSVMRFRNGTSFAFAVQTELHYPYQNEAPLTLLEAIVVVVGPEKDKTSYRPFSYTMLDCLCVLQPIWISNKTNWFDPAVIILKWISSFSFSNKKFCHHLQKF